MAHSLSSKSQGKQTSKISQCEAAGNDVMQVQQPLCRKTVEPNKPQFSLRVSRLKRLLQKFHCVCVFACVCAYAMWMCMHACVYVCMYICVYILMCYKGKGSIAITLSASFPSRHTHTHTGISRSYGSCPVTEKSTRNYRNH